jgi:hypothetical protein
MKHLSATLDGKPVYLYEFIQGSYEDRRNFLCAHVEELSRAEILARVRAALKTLPEEIEDYNYTAREPDLFERALLLVGFTVVEAPLALVARGVGIPATYRDSLEQSLDRFEDLART